MNEKANLQDQLLPAQVPSGYRALLQMLSPVDQQDTIGDENMSWVRGAMKVYDIIPCPKPRMTRADRWKQRPEVMRYRAFCDEVRLKKVAFDNNTHVFFILPMPWSWSKKKRSEMDGKPHQNRPDADNLIKALGDALYADDSGLWNYAVTKLWGAEGQIRIERI